MRTYSYTSSTSANATQTYRGGYSHTTLRQNESNLLSNARSLRSNYGKKTAKGRQKDGKRTITIRQRVEIESITTEHIADRSPIRTDYSLRRNRFLRFTATLLLLLTLGVGNVWADVWIRGDMNNWENNDAWKFNDGKLEVSLEANTDYTFKVWDEVGYENNHYRSYDLNGGKITGTIVKYNLDKDNVGGYDLVLHTDEAGTYIFQYAYEDSKYKLSIYFPKARLQKQKYVYFDARRLTGSNSDYWQRGDFTARFYFKYYDSGSDNANTDCTHANTLEDWVYYALVPNHDYIGQIQMNRLQVGTEDLCVANIAYAKDRPSSLENCLQEESGKENYCNSWTPQWTTYCPPMSSVSIADNGTTTWGGNGSSSTPYLVPTGGDIKVHVTASASALDDANMNRYFLFKKAGSAIGEGSTSTEKTITASSATGTKEEVIVEAYNYYNSTEGTHLASSAIYYEARTPYTISYSKGSPSDKISGSRDNDTKLKDVAFTLPGAIFTRTGYTQTGWATSDGGSKEYELSESYTANEDLPLFPFWTAKNYTINLEGMEADTEDPIQVNVTYDGVLSQVTPHTKTNYTFDGYWTSEDVGVTLGHQLIDADGNWIADVEGYTGNDGAGHPTWVHDFAISLYAKWTETPYTITPSVEPAGTGSVNTVTDAHLVTPSSTITATPANEAWIFDRWEYGTNVGHSSGDGNAITVTASQNSTIIAHFKPRYALVGTLMSGNEEVSGGNMPGWGYANAIPFTNNSFTALGKGDGKGVDISCTRSLNAGATYKFMILDRSSNGGSYGVAPGEGETFKALTEENQPLDFLNQDNQVFFYTAPTSSAMNYTFRITNITENDGKYYPTVTIERPHAVYFGTGYAGIDDLSSVTGGTTGGTLEVTTNSGALANEDYVTYGTDVTYTPSPETGYIFEGFYTSDEFTFRFTQDNPWIHYKLTGDDHVYAKFEEKSTSVTLANDGHGKVQISSTDKTSTTCGVTTTRELTAVPNEGYIFSSWTKTSGDDITISSTSTNPTTLTGLGTGATSGQTLTANFTYRYSIKGTMNGENWDRDHLIANIGTNASSKDTGYVEITLPANTTYEFAIYDKKTGVANPWLKNGTNEVFNMTYTNHTNWSFGTDKTSNCGITTAGKGTYKFIFNITDKTMTVIYPTSYQVNYASSVGGSVTSVKDGDNNEVPNGGYVCSGGRITFTAAANTYYTFVGWCNNDTYGDTFNTELSWTNSNVTETQNSFAKFKSTNFVIYRTGDKADDSRAALDDVESYAGGTISEVIEYRMKVHELDTWYTLCLPFTVNAVKVWDPDDGPAYFDIVPYYRTGEGLHSGHYFIRTPSSTTNFPIANFDDWRDPTSPTDYVPEENRPYIIQWHDPYFLGKYISFFGATGQEIPNAMTIGVAPDDNNVVNVYGNNAMVSGSVPGAYMLEPDYGSDGAWLRLDDASESRTIPPFECFIRASEPVTRNYVAIRRGMSLNDLSTGEAVIADNQIAPLIRVYTLSGILLTQYTDCSMSQVAYMLSIDRPAGIYILCSDKEAVKVIVGGK